MDAFFDWYDRWNGVVPCFLGVYLALLGFGYLPRKAKDSERVTKWRRKFGPMMKVLAPTLLVMGALQLYGGLTKDRLADAVRSLNVGPKMIDSSTRLDRAHEEPGRKLVIDQTIVTQRAADFPAGAWAKIAPEIKARVAASGWGRLSHHGITVVSRYYGSDGGLLGEVIVAPGDAK